MVSSDIISLLTELFRVSLEMVNGMEEAAAYLPTVSSMLDNTDTLNGKEKEPSFGPMVLK